ncbi:MarR family transcriptional regulator [Streptosporangiaceae bacterium NEAU-GS5]|nr:MarR family transcriptional regulator [Streptosporangiaceae bacterium NEAU-GS5]
MQSGTRGADRHAPDEIAHDADLNGDLDADLNGDLKADLNGDRNGDPDGELGTDADAGLGIGLGAGLDEVTTAVLTGSRLLVAIAVRSVAQVEDRVTVPQFRMLVVLGRRGKAKLVTLADLLGVNPSTAMRMADRLAAAGMIVREVNPQDRRESLMRLTREGERIVEEVTARRRAEISAIVSRMTPEQRQALIGGMTAFTEAGDEPPAPSAHSLGWPGD